MTMFNEQVAAQTRQILGGLRDPVRILFFTEGAASPLSGHVAEFLAELAALSPLIAVETRDLAGDAARAKELGVHHAPALLVDRAGGERFPVRYYGLPSGHEFGAFLRVLILLSTGAGMPGVDASAAAGIARAANLKVFVLAA